MRITVGSTPVDLLPERAAFLPESRTLVVADLHLGKSATFRARGLAVPEGSTADDLGRLSKLLRTTKASQLVIAGDLIHSHDSLSPAVVALFRGWLAEHHLPVILTEGNHDRRTSLAGFRFPLEVRTDHVFGSLLVTHDPADLMAGQSGMAGHLHPGIRIPESRRSSLRFPAFVLRGETHLILPAFSSFTGLQIVKPDPSDRFFVPLREGLTEIPASLAR